MPKPCQISIFIYKAVALDIDHNTIGQLSWRIERKGQKCLIHIYHRTASRHAKTNAIAHIKRITVRRCPIMDFGNIFCRHFLIHNKASRCQYHTAARLIKALLIILARHNPCHTTIRLYKQPDNTAIITNIDTCLFNSACQRIHKNAPAKISLM